MGDIIKTISKILGIVLLVAVLGAIIFNDYQQNKKINELLESNNSDGGMSQIQVESIISSFLTKNGYVAGETDKYVEAENLENEISKVLKEELKDVETVDAEALEKSLKEYIDEKLAELSEKDEDTKDKSKDDKKTTTTTKKSPSSTNKKPTTPSQGTPQTPSTPSVTPPPSNTENTTNDDAFVVDDDEQTVID